MCTESFHNVTTDTSKYFLVIVNFWLVNFIGCFTILYNNNNNNENNIYLLHFYIALIFK